MVESFSYTFTSHFETNPEYSSTSYFSIYQMHSFVCIKIIVMLVYDSISGFSPGFPSGAALLLT